jgi:hypothetical protein
LNVVSFSELQSRPRPFLRCVAGEAVEGAGGDLEVDAAFEGGRLDHQTDEAVVAEVGRITIARSVGDLPTEKKSFNYISKNSNKMLNEFGEVVKA